MEVVRFTWGGVLKVVFNAVARPPVDLARFYVDRDRTLIYRWLRDEAAPPPNRLGPIVRFVMDSTHEAERAKLRIEMNAYIEASTLEDPVKTALIEEGDFETYVAAVLRLALTERRKKPREDPPPTRLVVPLVTIVFALLAAISGGLIWNLVNHLASWGYYMGGSGNEPSGVAGLLWGLIIGLPIIICAELTLGFTKVTPETLKLDQGLTVGLFSLATAVAGFIFYNSGIRGTIEGLALPYAAQELTIALTHATILSSLPLLTIFAAQGFRPRNPRLLILIFGLPVVVPGLAALGTALVGLPESEVAQLRGFVVGLLLRLSMFISTWTLLSGSLKPSTSPT
ncbi:MAG: hypothetical protein LBE83_02100 [Propionibacteriaceae bacterium]|jgi:hypothetical protein|nr:hypothetical protein [Propionibacteriaceae bacterium]